MDSDHQIAICKNCSATLSEPNGVERTPCPVCGETARIHNENIKEELSLYDHMRMKGKHEGKGKQFFDARVGADYYSREEEWRHIERVIDRDNNLYVEIIKDMKTGTTIKEVREPLTTHQGHGSAKKKN